MRALRIGALSLGVLAVALWMAWITLRVEASAQNAQAACTFSYLAAEKVGVSREPPAPCWPYIGFHHGPGYSN
jgi:hypothetical protein